MTGAGGRRNSAIRDRPEGRARSESGGDTGVRNRHNVGRKRGRARQRRNRVKVFQRETHLRTVGWLAVRDITAEVTQVVKESEVQDGIACIYSPHTTCIVRVNEFEQGFLQ